MRLSLYTNSVWRRRLARGVAVFFVLFVIVDIAASQDCAESVARMPIGRPASVFADGKTLDVTHPSVAVVTRGDSRQEQPTGEAPHDGDCLGCCAHVLPAGFHKMIGPKASSLPTLTNNDSFTSPPLRGAYHPPRSA